MTNYLMLKNLAKAGINFSFIVIPYIMNVHKIIASALLPIFIINGTKGQNWPKIHGNAFHAIVNNVIEDYDHGYLICGSIMSNPNTFKYAWIIKTDINGNELWNKKYGNGVDQNFLNSCANTANEGLVACGATAIEDPQLDPLFYKLDICGDPEWCKILKSQGFNGATDVIATNDGYIGMLKYHRSDSLYARISLVKMNLDGEPLWIQYLAQEDSLINDEEGRYLYLTRDQNYLVSGDCFHPGLKAFWIKTDTTGNQIWDLIWEGGYSGAYQVVENNTGYFYSAGGLFKPGTAFAPAIFKFDNQGNPTYYQCLLDADTLVGGGARPISFYHDSLLLVGINWRINPNNVDDGYSEILKTDTLGNIIKRRILLHENMPPKDIAVTYDNKIITTGMYVTDNNWDIYLWKMNENLEDDSLYTQPLTYDSLCPYEIQSDTVDLDCGVFVNIDELPTKEEYESTIKIYPNPARDWVALTLPDVVAGGPIELRVYDIFGMEAWGHGGMGAGKQGGGEMVTVNRMVLLNVKEYPVGMYVAVAVDKKGRRYTGKFVVAK
jgi:hypothetical protein